MPFIGHGQRVGLAFAPQQSSRGARTSPLSFPQTNVNHNRLVPIAQVRAALRAELARGRKLEQLLADLNLKQDLRDRLVEALKEKRNAPKDGAYGGHHFLALLCFCDSSVHRKLQLESSRDVL